jgi:AraC-like DNA-binding protein
MESLPPVSGLGIDPVTRARRYDYSLSEATPLHANSNFYPQQTPLEIDVHEGTEVGVVLTGGEERKHDDQAIALGPGDVWLCAAWEPHGWRITAPETRDVVMIFLPEFLGEERLGEVPWLALFAPSPSERPRVTSPSVREKTLAIGREILAEIEQQSPGWESALRLDLLRVLLAVSRDWRPPARFDGRSKRRARNLPRIMPALALAHSRPRRRVTVAEAAESCDLSRAQFCLIFRNTMGMSFGKFCLQSRLGFVAQMLITSDLSTEKIAEETGFANGSHLHRAFVKQYDCTPGLYRSRRQWLGTLSPDRR